MLNSQSVRTGCLGDWLIASVAQLKDGQLMPVRARIKDPVRRDTSVSYAAGLIKLETNDQVTAAFLAAVVRGRCNIIVTGGVNAGKTA
jgi:Flp pilus assembly CpaF family ATPase